MPPRVLVTGASGFIGRTLVQRLTDLGHDVVGADLRPRAAPNGTHVRIDLARDDVHRLCDGIDVIYHLAGRPGVQSSWGDGFRAHLDANLDAGLRLLEAALDQGVARVVLASSSSVYGRLHHHASESDRPRPVSPYGVTKAALEQLAHVYGERGLSTVVLRYFTVYGPHQRPDMAFHRIIRAGLGGPPFPQRGDGSQCRDFTYVEDAVRATVAAGLADVAPGTVVNVGSARPLPVRDAVALVAELLGRPVPIVQRPRPPGDPDCTAATIERAARLLGWRPTTPLEEGLSRQIDAARHNAGAGGNAAAEPAGSRIEPQLTVA